MPPGFESKSFIRNFVGVSLGNYGAIALSFVLNVILTWRLGAEQFGRLALLIMAVQVLACLIANWTLTGLIKFGTQEFIRTGSLAETFWARTYIVAPWVVVAGIMIRIWQEEAAGYLSIPLWGVWVVFGYFLFSSLLLTVGSVFQASHRMDHYAVTLFLDKALAILAVLVLPLPYARDPVMILGCYALSSLLVSSWAVVSLGARMFLPVKVSREAICTLWRFSIPMIISTWVIIFGAQWIDFAIIKHFLPFSDLGLYSLASQVTGVVQQITIISSTLLLPHFVLLIEKEAHTDIKAAVEKVMPYGFLGFAFLLSAVVFSARLGMPLLFGPSFSGSVWPLMLLMIATMGLALFNTFSPLLNAHGLNWGITGILIISVSTNVFTNLLFIPAYGINGAAIARVVAYTIAAGLMLALIQKRFGIRTLRLGLFGCPVLIAVLSAVVFEGSLFYLAGVIGVAASSYCLVYMFGLFSREDLALAAQSNMPMFIKSGLAKVFPQKMGVTTT